MASTTPQNNARELTSQLWAMANDLRAKMDASEYRDYILGFIFYRYLSKRQERNLASSAPSTSPILKSARTRKTSTMRMRAK
ncbi:type I restriction-modification system subunit M N-terminal domain-containing protein [Bifidobacterium pseudolongum subsp. globosum]|uniref:type I restriction-modification system subunit M N-terminal domain-containing protein n=1 Tax=Bifidobacterium pseudolongum TaxID=1694 RepID=UPI0039955D13